MPASIVGALAFALILWQLAIPRPYYTGTDSVDVSGIAVYVKTGQRLCVPDLYLPAGTGQVRLALFAQQPIVRAEVSVVAEGTTTSSRVSGAIGPGNQGFLLAPIPLRPSSPDYVPASVCVRPLNGAVGVAGMAGLPYGYVPSRLDGAPVLQRIAVWFLPPAGRERSLLASAGTIFSRAALFRPGIVGAWTYPFLLFVVLPLSWLVSLLLLARAAAGRPLRVRRREVHTAVVIALVAFVNAASGAGRNTAFNNPKKTNPIAYRP